MIMNRLDKIQYSRYFLALFFLLSILAGCKPDKVTPVSKPAYFPLKAGRFYIYNVDSIRYQNVPFTVKEPDTVHYLLKDSVVSSFRDHSGQLVFRIDQFRKNPSSIGWQFRKTFTRTNTSLDAEETDGNNRYVKLVYPVYSGRSWNANKYNSDDSLHTLTSSYAEINKSWSSQGLKYDSTVLVQIQNDSNLVNTYIQTERYAANVGLIYRRHDSVFDHWNGDNTSPHVLEGYKRQQVLSNYGPR
jgi:hypothetical protein